MNAIKITTKDENGQNKLHLEITQVVQVYFNTANNEYQHNSRVLYTYIPNKSFGQLLDISKNIGKNLSDKYSQNLFDHA